MEISVSYVNPTTTVRSMLVMNLMMIIIHEVVEEEEEEEEEELEVFAPFLSLSLSRSIDRSLSLLCLLVVA